MDQVAGSGLLTRPGGGEGSSEGEKTVSFFFILFFEPSLYSHFHGPFTSFPPSLSDSGQSFCPLTAHVPLKVDIVPSVQALPCLLWLLFPSPMFAVSGEEG